MTRFDPATLRATIGLADTEITLDVAGAAMVQHAMLSAITLHDVDVLAGRVSQVTADDIAERLHATCGAWRFGATSTLALLLRHVGFDVAVSGAALLLDGPNQQVDHIVLEVTAPEMTPHLLDAGLVDGPIAPIDLNSHAVQHIGHRTYQLWPSPQGTTLAMIDDGVPRALLRYRRVTHAISDFADTIVRERARHRDSGAGPSATRLLGRGDDRVHLHGDTLRVTVDGTIDERRVVEPAAAMSEWFPALVVDD